MWFDRQNDKSKKLNHQRGVTVQIALQISEYCNALASATVNAAELTPRLLKVESEVTVYMQHKPFSVSVNTKRNIIKDIKHHLYIKMPQITAPERDVSLLNTEMPRTEDNCDVATSHFCQQEDGAKRSDVNNCYSTNMLQHWLFFLYCQDVNKTHFPAPYAINFISDCWSHWNIRSNWIQGGHFSVSLYFL